MPFHTLRHSTLLQPHPLLFIRNNRLPPLNHLNPSRQRRLQKLPWQRPSLLFHPKRRMIIAIKYTPMARHIINNTTQILIAKLHLARGHVQRDSINLDFIPVCELALVLRRFYYYSS
jgi:hypothetical protein